MTAARAGLWTGGLAGSLALHGGAAIALLWALQPDPIRPQPSPHAQLAVETQAVDRAAAQPRRPDAEAVDAAPAEGAQLDQGAIPRSKAAAVEAPAEALASAEPRIASAAPTPAAGQALPATLPDTDALSASSPAPAALTAAQPAAAALPAAVAPSATALTAAAPLAQAVTVQAAPAPVLAAQPAPAATLPASPPPSAALSASVPAAQVAAALAAAPDRLTQAAPDAAALAAQPPQTEAGPALPLAAPVLPAAAPTPQPARPSSVAAAELAQQDPGADALPAVAPPAEKGTAMLAFSGAEGVTDPLSLAAYQSFVAPDTLRPGDNMRDGLAGTLAAVPCARIQARFQPETGVLELVGHIPEAALRTPVLAAMQAQVGRDIRVADGLRILPSPQCQALTGIADAGLPQSTDQITNPLLLGADTYVREFSYKAGDQLVLDMTAPDYDAYLYVDYFDANGQVIHLSPNEITPQVHAAAKSQLTVGARAPNDPGLFITIGPPYGQEITVAFAASVPLFTTPRPLVEPAGPYLQALRAEVARARAAHPDFKGEWVYFFVSTAPR
ncbi:MAG: DUF4384 domain-containing protein [Roseivivax sp.]|nr:DUF4384 domain-containing protein [Roseivivax sp.]